MHKGSRRKTWKCGWIQLGRDVTFQRRNATAVKRGGHRARCLRAVFVTTQQLGARALCSGYPRARVPTALGTGLVLILSRALEVGRGPGPLIGWLRGRLAWKSDGMATLNASLLRRLARDLDGLVRSAGSSETVTEGGILNRTMIPTEPRWTGPVRELVMSFMLLPIWRGRLGAHEVSAVARSRGATSRRHCAAGRSAPRPA
jgi:hypothetical protein